MGKIYAVVSIGDCGPLYADGGMDPLQAYGMPDPAPITCRECEHACKIVLTDKTEHYLCAIERDEGDFRADLYEVDPDELCEIDY